LTPVKKPSEVPIALALAELGNPDPRRVYMVGDQYFTDIAGANLGGVSSIRVPTWQPKSFPLVLRTFQSFETILYRFLYGRPRG
ncbi:MAG: HAD hydrolase-like protein, partial [Gemmatimonadales bacterium]